jgi:hypothetical protein
MPKFENEVLTFLKKQDKIKLIQDSTNEFDKIDFILEYEIRFVLDLKEKKAQYRKRWCEIAQMDEEELFIFDELGIRKLFSFFPYCFIIVKNEILKSYFVFNCWNLLCLPRIRVNREIFKVKKMYKGKWLVSFKWAVSYGNLEDTFDYICGELCKIDETLKFLPCLQIPNLNDIHILDEDYTRIPYYWKKDINEK